MSRRRDTRAAMSTRNSAGGVGEYKREAAALFADHTAARREYVAARRAGNSRAMASMLAEAMIE